MAPRAEPVVLGIVAAGDAALPLAEALGEDLPAELTRRFPEVEWRVVVREAPAPPASAGGGELVEALRRRLLAEGWELAVALTDLPLHAGARPVTAHASAIHGVGLLSVPALGAVAVQRRLRTAVLRLVEGLLGESAGSAADRHDAGRHARMAARLRELASPLGRAQVHDDGTVRFVGATLRRNLRLLVGMVRANRPLRLVPRLSGALIGALGTGAFAIATSDVWLLADGMRWPRLAGLSVFSIVAACAALIGAHELWERARATDARERVILFNIATAVTVALGVLALYVVLFALTAACGAALIATDVLARGLAHDVGTGDYLQLAWLAATLATIGGALGSLVDSDLDVRDAAYRSREDERTEAEAESHAAAEAEAEVGRPS